MGRTQTPPTPAEHAALREWKGGPVTSALEWKQRTREEHEKLRKIRNTAASKRSRLSLRDTRQRLEGIIQEQQTIIRQLRRENADLWRYHRFPFD